MKLLPAAIFLSTATSHVDQVGLLVRIVPIVAVVLYAAHKWWCQRWRRRPRIIAATCLLLVSALVLRYLGLEEWTTIPGIIGVGLSCLVFSRYMRDEVRSA